MKLLKTALLLWDELKFIVPTPDYPMSYEDPAFAEAVELIGRRHCPTDYERHDAHQLVEEFFTRALPEAFEYDARSFPHRVREFAPRIKENYRRYQWPYDYLIGNGVPGMPGVPWKVAAPS